MVILNKIDEIMRKQGVSDADVAEATGLTRMTIGNARRGKSITLINALRISRALATPLEEIWSYIREGEDEDLEEAEEVA